jgi:polyphosphate glucokinase
MDRVTKKALKTYGQEKWTEAVIEAVEILQNIVKPDETILGGGNARFIDPWPANCRRVDNRAAYVGAQRLWEGSDLFASACPTSWRIHRDEAHA